MGGAQVNVATCAPPILGNTMPVSEAPVLPLSNVKFNLCASATNTVYVLLFSLSGNDPQLVESNLYLAFWQLGNFQRISSSLLRPGTKAA